MILGSLFSSSASQDFLRPFFLSSENSKRKAKKPRSIELSHDISSTRCFWKKIHDRCTTRLPPANASHMSSPLKFPLTKLRHGIQSRPHPHLTPPQIPTRQHNPPLPLPRISTLHHPKPPHHPRHHKRRLPQRFIFPHTSSRPRSKGHVLPSQRRFTHTSFVPALGVEDFGVGAPD